jgi:hypothetical protein
MRKHSSKEFHNSDAQNLAECGWMPTIQDLDRPIRAHEKCRAMDVLIKTCSPANLHTTSKPATNTYHIVRFRSRMYHLRNLVVSSIASVLLRDVPFTWAS